MCSSLLSPNVHQRFLVPHEVSDDSHRVEIRVSTLVRSFIPSWWVSSTSGLTRLVMDLVCYLKFLARTSQDLTVQRCITLGGFGQRTLWVFGKWLVVVSGAH